jgi:localization factor PodJL
MRIAATESKIEAFLARSSDASLIPPMAKGVELLQGELEHLAALHANSSNEIAGLTAEIAKISDRTGEIGSVNASLLRLNERLVALQSDLPRLTGEAMEAAGRRMAPEPGPNDLAEKLAVIQNLLVLGARERQEMDGRAQGALDSIHGLVANLHERLTALEEEAPEVATVISPGQELATAAHGRSIGPVPGQDEEPLARPQFGMLPSRSADPADDADLIQTGAPTAATSAGPAQESGEVDAPALTKTAKGLSERPAQMSREDLIASARRAANSAAQRHRSVVGSATRPAAVSPGSKTSKLGVMGISAVAVIALLSVAGGMVASKLLFKRTPSLTIEQTDLPSEPMDTIAPADGPTNQVPAQTMVPTPSASAPSSGAMPGNVNPAPAQPSGKSSNLQLDQPPAVSSAIDGAARSAYGGEPTAQLASLSSQVTASPLAAIPPGIAPLSVRNAAITGDPVAQYEIGNRFALGKGAAKDLPASVAWFQRSASAGYPLAQYRLGELYEHGAGIAKDLARARDWYGRAAEKGNVNAMHNLGVLYASQPASSPDYASALTWFTKAAEYGLKDSQFNLAVLYQNGLGTKRDLVQAYTWYEIAQARGDQVSGKRRADIRKQLTQEAAAKADAMAGAWHPKVRDQVANDGTGIGQFQTAGAVSDKSSDAASQVGLVQQMLSELGYDTGTTDGTLTDATRQAIRTFERRSGMQETGEISAELIRKLKALAG